MTLPCSNYAESFDSIHKKLNSIGEKLSLVDSLVDVAKKIMECVICKSVVQSPVVSKCCQRIIGCRACVNTWRGTSTRCPLCSICGRMSDLLELKGFDDVTSLLRAGDRESESTTIAVDSGETSSDDFEDLPNFPVPTTSSH